MKIASTILTVSVALIALQGCTTLVPIKTQTSKIKEVAKCIADGDSHGQCNGKNVFKAARLHDYDGDYFGALATMNLPDTINENRLLQFSGQGVVGLDSTIKKYSAQYKKLDCGATYNMEAANIAKNALGSDTNINIHTLFKIQLSGADSALAPSTVIKFDLNKVGEFLKDISEAESYGGINSLQCASLQNMSIATTKKEAAELDMLLAELSYIKAYFKAYFRQGRFIQGKLKVNELYSKLKTKIKDESSFLSDDQVADLANNIFRKLTGKEYASACTSGTDCEINFAGKLESNQFVTRAGVEYGFPHITVSVDPLAEKKVSVTEIDWNKIGAEVAKVYVEAVGDHLIGLPADPRSTACKINSTLCYSEQDGGITADDLASVGEHSDKIDTLVSLAVGKAIRGAGWISLNNEAIASIIESAVGTAAKKSAEKVAYCTYSCATNKTNAVMQSLQLNEVAVEITR